jgi:hypothetical protein
MTPKHRGVNEHRDAYQLRHQPVTSSTQVQVREAKSKTQTKPSCLTTRPDEENPKSNKITPQLFCATIQKKKRYTNKK